MTDGDDLLQLALGAYAEGDLDSAEQHLRALVVLQPENAELRHALGQLLLHRGQAEEAAVCFQTAVDLNPVALPYLYDLALAQAEAGRYAEASGPLYQCLGIDPAYPGAKLALACVDAAQRRYDSARERFKEAFADEPDAPAACHAWVERLLQQGQAGEAFFVLELALAAAPNDRPLRELQRSLQTQTVDFGQTLTVDATPAKLRRVVIEVTTWCNLDCPGCFRTQSIAAGHWTNKHIAPETFAKIVANLPPCRQGVLHGIGEPTMHPRYLELVEIAKASGRFDSLVCNTNAQARNIDFYRAVIEKGLDFFQVSVDSLTPEVAAVTRAGTDVEKLRRNLAEFHRLGLPFSVQMVISRLNYDDIDLTLRALDAMGPCTVNIQPFVDSDATHNALSKDMAARFLDKIRHLAGQMVNLNINAGGFYHFGINRREPYVPLCTSPWFDPAVNVDGFMMPCCMHWDPQTLGHSNLSETSFAQAFGSQPVQAFLDGYMRTSPNFCARCSENVRCLAAGNG